LSFFFVFFLLSTIVVTASAALSFALPLLSYDYFYFSSFDFFLGLIVFLVSLPFLSCTTTLLFDCCLTIRFGFFFDCSSFLFEVL